MVLHNKGLLMTVLRYIWKTLANILLQKCHRRTCLICTAFLVGALIVGVGLAAGLAMGLRKDSENNSATKTPVYKSSTQTYKYAAVVADSKVSSDIGNDILGRKRGNAIDATVAALLATGVLSAHSAGIGGGSFFVIYHKEHGWHSVDSRETAPAAATTDMYLPPEDRTKSMYGGMAIAVPGEVKGLYEVHKKFGKVAWKDVVMPTVKLCQDGVPLTRALHHALSRLQSDEDKNKFLPYFDHNRNVKPIGSLIKLPKLAKTFQAIADNPLSFYNGSLASDIVADIKDAGGIIELKDLESYSLKWDKPTEMHLPGDICVYSVPPPGSGPVLSYILSILSGYKFSPESISTDEESILTHHRIIEAMKFAYGKRTELGDSNFVDVKKDVENMTSLAYGEAIRQLIDDKETHETNYYKPSFYNNNDEGTAHISVVDAEGNAVSVTSTINTYFGSRVRGNRTGIIFNNEMDDFSTPNTANYFGLPASEANFIRPGKRPMSSMCPAIVWDEKAKKVRLVTGAAGGSKITTSTALNIMDVLWFGMSLPASIDRPRLHHQLMPPELVVEKDYPETILNGLRAKGHVTKNMVGYSVVQAADVLENGIVGTADFRKGGEPSGF
ncbi:glutathione hydrolase 1 proenzyme-like isoform X1 [Physella acuta]|uniref:glutathione hydrolase 1 proenzyme-like isoform X1 n=2 Tax=Physella acuta TaxID=109671 RepID=UPI0027DCAF0B|nr:glutathione hydrolase 1 proenzyme-like isoform X1 [Physella acuta]